jgi:uroporphyrinogen decarboxylase
MTGLERIFRVLAGHDVDSPAALPIVHAGLAPMFDVPLGRFFTHAQTMAEVICGGYRRFGYDGVTLSLGVTAEAEALGARVEQPTDAAPVLKEHLLADMSAVGRLRRLDPARGGRMPLFFEAVAEVMDRIGQEAFVLPILRGPMLAASQLRGVEQLLVDLIEQPDLVEQVLDLTTELALRLGRDLAETGAPALMLGEATCSPNFISPQHYRLFIQPRHQYLIARLKDAGWRAVGLHVCGDTRSILDDMVATGADLLDIDHQVPVEEAMAMADDRIVLRGNLDPSAVLRFATPDEIRTQTHQLCRVVEGRRWIVSSGCDIPPGTPKENLRAFADAVRG